jgi:hypothetical protein
MKHPMAPKLKVGDIRSFNIRVIVHFNSFFKIFRIYVFFIFPSNFHLPCIWTIYNFNWYFIFVTFKKPFLSFNLIFHCKKKTFVIILTRVSPA